MASAVKKPPATGRETPTGTPQRPTPRASTPSSTSSPSGAGAAGVARTRSTRTGTPVSARAAAHQRRESMLSNGPSVNGKGSSSPDMEREEAVRAEMMAIIDDLKERLSQAESSSEMYKRQAEVLQSKLDDALKEQAKLEEKVHESDEQIESLTNEKREAARQIREMETIYEAERSAMMKEKEEMANREEEMQTVIQRLKDSLAQRNLDEDRPTRQSANSSPSIENGSFAPPSSIHRSDSRNNSKLLLQKDRLIESLRLELAEAQIKLVESQNQGGGRLQEVERQLMEARVANARLMEDNESYQLLLQERTLKGDFATNDLGYSGGASANQDALAALEGRTRGTSLADELSGAHDNDHSHEHDTETQRRLEAELKSVKDQNKALTLYINKIIERLLQHQGFEHILDQSSDFKGAPPPNTNKDLPPPPAPKPAPAPSLLQRAKSIAIGSSAPKPKPRPMTYMPSANQPTTTSSSAISNPDTAPSIPIGLTRSASTRRGRPMSEQYTGMAGAASIVNAMYKGPSAADGPLSPSLRSSQAFFLPQGAGNRTSAGNFPGMKSETSSTSGDSVSAGGGSGGGGAGGETASTSSPGQSPPRPHHSEKSTTLAGNKPRPLRLVQENAEAAAPAPAASKRQSWVGWVGSAFAGAKKEDAGAAAEVIRE
ncbi:570310b0-960a-46d9-8bf1-304d559a776d [Thermothielavioides terrestris]|uniref:M protein, serotype 2.1 n=2 Tax=Thermothielavioides terrestris TaxID=2587410 RepID=G2QTV7_THETT|nr:uncharacterized protein THITE_2109127 [Thermothielavioides terrestris NRRL 8126]AEO63616.1 hypothetical protein THITE_2109127 [Thermothielavioides terrestris NRRL 8126]SPQ20890.1 570310b0-960a-46d9-8bf1-304d559a776d [Thermothielavioides terrestris]